MTCKKHRALYPLAVLGIPFSFNDICQVAQHCCNTTRYSVHINHGILSLLSVSDGLHSRHLVSYFRLLQRDKNNLEALRMLALHSLCRNGDITEVTCLQLLIPYMWITRNQESGSTYWQHNGTVSKSAIEVEHKKCFLPPFCSQQSCFQISSAVWRSWNPRTQSCSTGCLSPSPVS